MNVEFNKPKENSDVNNHNESKMFIPKPYNFIMDKMIKVKIKKLHPDAKIPTYATEGSVGMDIYSIDCEYKADIDCFVYHTGLAFEIPEGYGLFPIPQSRNRKTDFYIPNTPGLVDVDFRGEVVLSYKSRDKYLQKQPFNVGEKCGQLVLLPCPKIEFEEVEELSETNRGEGGHGSTGN